MYTLYGDEESEQYTQQKIKDVQNKISKVTKNEYMSLNDALNVFSFRLTDDGYSNAKNYYYNG